MKDRLVQSILWLLSKQGVPSVIPWAFRNIRTLYESSPEDYLSLLLEQADREDWIYQFFAAHELGTLYERYPEKVLPRLRELSGSDVEIVREGSAKSWSLILEEDFDSAFEELCTLQEDGSYEERYTAAIAPVRFYREGQPSEDQREKLLNYWEDFRDDPKQGLWNIVRTQILNDIEDGNGE